MIMLTIILLLMIIYCNGYVPVSRIKKTNSNNIIMCTSASSSSSVSIELYKLIKDFIKNESLVSFVPKDDVIMILEEIKSNEQLWIDNKIVYDDYWNKLDEKLRLENRPLNELLGDSITSKILKTVQEIDVYDPTAVRTFLQTPAIELMISGILYEGIFEFLQRVDIIGNVVNQLPILGPIRKSIVKEFKSQLDKVLAPQVKTFLSTFNRVAVERMISFVLSKENRLGFATANKKLVENILSRKISTLIPSKSSSFNLKEVLWAALREVPIKDLQPSVDILYEQVGDKSISSFIDVDKVLDSSTTARNLLARNINKFISSDLGKEAISKVQGDH